MDLQDVEAVLLEDIGNDLTLVATSRVHVSVLANRLELLGLEFEALGLCRLQLTANGERFRESLIRSAQTRLYFLREGRAGGAEPVANLALSRSRATLAALAAGSQRVAREVAQASLDAWNPAWEYEDDFLYLHFIHRLLIGGPNTRESLNATIQQMSVVLNGTPSVRLALCTALVNRDQPAFSKALRALVTAEKAQNDAEPVKTDEVERLLFWPNRAVSLEGLALLKVGELAGITVSEQLPMCPAPGRLPWNERPVRNLVEESAQLRGQ